MYWNRFFGFLGGVLTIAIAAIALWYQVRKAHITVSVRSILNVTRTLGVSDAKIKIRNEEIPLNKKDIYQIGLRIISDGKSIASSDFPDQWGIGTGSGEVLDAKATGANGDLVGILNSGITFAGSKVQLPKFNFNEGVEFNLQITVAGNRDQEPNVLGFGLIRDASVDIEHERRRPTFVAEVIQGNPIVHLVRFISYMIALFIFFMPFAIMTNGSSDAKRSRKAVKKVFAQLSEEKNSHQKLILKNIHTAIEADINGASGGWSNPFRCAKVVSEIGSTPFPVNRGLRETINGKYINHEFFRPWAIESAGAESMRFRKEVVDLCSELVMIAPRLGIYVS